MLRSRLAVSGRSPDRRSIPVIHSSPLPTSVHPAIHAPTAAQSPCVPHPASGAVPSSPNSRTRLEARLAALEGGAHAVAFDSTAAARAALNRATAVRTTLTWVQTLPDDGTEPNDVAESVRTAHAGGARVVVDNTPTPTLLNPLSAGADVVLHSSLTRLEGHGDAQGAVLITCDPDLAQRIRNHRDASGTALDPLAAWLVGMGMDTLSVRMARASASARAIAHMLHSDRRVGAVRYPAIGQSLEVEFRNAAAAAGFADSTRLFAQSGAVGGIASQLRVAEGTTGATTVRLITGIEDTADLQADVTAALDRAMAWMAHRM